MDTAQPWYKSRTILANLFNKAIIIAGAFGYYIAPETQQSIIVSVSAVLTFAGNAASIFGRIKAFKRIM